MIILLDAAGLEAHSCECYALMRERYDRQLDEAMGPGGTGGWSVSVPLGEVP